MTTTNWRADPLIWGHGPRVLEAFLEPTCPYSARSFPKLHEVVSTLGEDRVTLKVRLHSQPWHMFSPVLVRLIVAASTLPSGKEAAKKLMTVIYSRVPEFEFEGHVTGPNRDATPNDLIRRAEGYTGLKLMDAFNLPGLDKEIRWHSRYSRQNGIHVSPTFMVDGIVQSDMSSGDEVEKWIEKLS